MAIKTSDDYEEITDFNNVAKKVIEKYPELFPNVDPDEFLDLLRVVVKKGAEREDGDIEYEVKGIGFPVRMFCESGYVVTIYETDWSTMDEAHKAILCLKIMKRLSRLTSSQPGQIIPLPREILRL